jgi:hypothetical protein
MLAAMMTTSDITQPGYYWFYDAIGAPAQPVEVTAGDGRGEWRVQFIGSDELLRLRDLAGALLPAPAPAAG